MPVDHIRYDLLTQQALRAVVRRVLTDVAKTGSLPGEHHFYVTFDTRAPGVKMSPRLREQYPEEMTIVLQHQFWDLEVSDMHFEVALSFNGIAEKLYVPLDTVKGFFDPSVQFGLQFETVSEDGAPRDIAATEAMPARPKPREAEPPAAIGPATPARAAPPRIETAKSETAKSEAAKSEAAKSESAKSESAKSGPTKAEPAKPDPAKPAVVAGKDKPEPDKPSGGAEVVRLDRFRKK